MAMKVKLHRLILAALVSLALSAPAAAELAESGVGSGGTIGGPIEGEIGGPFTLVDHHGNTVTDADFRGHFMFIYFGYTYCPDVCPTSAVMMAQTMDQLDKEGENVIPIIITIDPERDTPEIMKGYVAHFHPRIVGLSGTLAQVEVAAKAYKVYAEKVFEQGWGVDDYFIYHSDVIYFMGPDGKYLDHFRSGSTPKVMAARMRVHMTAAHQ
ncbi:MAG: SCO family protein [Rhodospirillaceae bacterium]|nr:SCO family protein [Rhodospirillaceae bacterium]